MIVPTLWFPAPGRPRSMPKANYSDNTRRLVQAKMNEVSSLKYQFVNRAFKPVTGILVDSQTGHIGKRLNRGIEPNLPCKGVINRMLRNMQNLFSNQIFHRGRNVNCPAFHLPRPLLWATFIARSFRCSSSK